MQAAKVLHEGMQHENIILSLPLMLSKCMNLLGQPGGVHTYFLYFQVRK